MRRAQRYLASFAACLVFIFCIGVINDQRNGLRGITRIPVFRSSEHNGSNIVLRTEMHNDEYCIGYNFLEATELFREDGLEPITLALHATSEMLKTLENRPSNWDGPISLGLFLDFHSTKSLEYLSDVHRCDDEFRRKVSVHIAFRLSPFQTSCPIIETPMTNRACEQFLKNRKEIRESVSGPFQIYPSNLMRNIARIGAKSDIHFIVDGDMTLSEGFAEKVKPIANKMIDGRSKKLLVVRRFESNNTVVPKNHTELKKAIEKKQVFQFHHKFFFVGHKIANLSHWFNVSDASQKIVAWEIPYSSSEWEIQVILHRNDLYNPDYFPARIRVMQSLIYSLCRAGYTYHLLSHVFDVHDGIKTGDTTYSKSVISHQKAYARKKAYDRFKQEMNTTYPETYKKCGAFVM